MHSLECVRKEDIDGFSLTETLLNVKNMHFQDEIQKTVHAHLGTLKGYFINISQQLNRRRWTTLNGWLTDNKKN